MGFFKPRNIIVRKVLPWPLSQITNSAITSANRPAKKGRRKAMRKPRTERKQDQ